MRSNHTKDPSFFNIFNPGQFSNIQEESCQAENVHIFSLYAINPPLLRLVEIMGIFLRIYQDQGQKKSTATLLSENAVRLLKCIIMEALIMMPRGWIQN